MAGMPEEFAERLVATRFNHGALRPLLCYRDAFRLLQGHYGLFLLIVFVGTTIAYMVPFGILLGPIWCGFAIFLLNRIDGRRATFANLFDGFRFFGPSALPAILLVTLATIAFVVIYIVYFAASIGVLMAELGQGNPPGPAFVATFGGFTVLYVVGAITAWVVCTAPFVFVFPLIVDRGLSGGQALWTTYKAMAANLPGFIGLMIIDVSLDFVGTFAGCIGWYLVIPLIFAADMVAYRQVFPRMVPEDHDWDEPELEPEVPARAASDAGPASTDIRSRPRDRQEPQTGIRSGPLPEQGITEK